jgi:hypothetical protein
MGRFQGHVTAWSLTCMTAALLHLPSACSSTSWHRPPPTPLPPTIPCSRHTLFQSHLTSCPTTAPLQARDLVLHSVVLSPLEISERYPGTTGDRVTAACLQLVAYLSGLTLRSSSASQQDRLQLPPLRSGSLAAASSSAGGSGPGAGAQGTTGRSRPMSVRQQRARMEALVVESLLEMVPRTRWPQGCGDLGQLWKEHVRPLFAAELPEVRAAGYCLQLLYTECHCSDVSACTVVLHATTRLTRAWDSSMPLLLVQSDQPSQKLQTHHTILPVLALANKLSLDTLYAMPLGPRYSMPTALKPGTMPPCLADDRPGGPVSGP